MESLLFVPERLYASKVLSLYEALFMKVKVESERPFIKDSFHPRRRICA